MDRRTTPKKAALINLAGADSNDASCEGARLHESGDCRLANGRYADAACCAAPVEDLQCDVVSVGVSELEEGSCYDITEEGYSNADEDAEDISVDADGILLGHHSFSSEDGDTIRFTAAGEQLAIVDCRSIDLPEEND